MPELYRSSAASMVERRRARRQARVADALARIPSEFLSRSDWEAVQVRADAFGIVPGQVYGRRADSAPTEAYTLEPFIGSLTVVPFTFAPRGWQECNGALLAIADFDTLFTLIGTTYGGDGQATFAVPDLRGRIPIHAWQGPGLSNRVLGETGGTEYVTLTAQQMPAHTHGLVTAATGTAVSPANAIPASVDLALPARYAPTVGVDRMAATAGAGGGQPHSHLPPYLGLRFCISFFGIFPPQA